MRFPARVLFFLALVALTGCWGEVRSPLGKRAVVKGKVTLSGKPLGRGRVVFTPVDAAKGDEQTRELNTTGEYAIPLFPGKYKVSISENTGIPAKYRSPTSTDQEVDIPADGKEGANFDLK